MGSRSGSSEVGWDWSQVSLAWTGCSQSAFNPIPPQKLFPPTFTNSPTDSRVPLVWVVTDSSNDRPSLWSHVPDFQLERRFDALFEAPIVKEDDLEKVEEVVV